MPFHPFMLLEPPPPPISYIWCMKVSTYSHSYCPQRVILCVIFWKNDIGLLGFFWFCSPKQVVMNRIEAISITLHYLHLMV